MDSMDALLEYIDEIWKMAFSKCGNTHDADDLVQDTYLAALTALRSGKFIQYPRTWLANTLMHIFGSRMREKYRLPIISLNESAVQSIAEYASSAEEKEEEIHLRKCIASLTELYRNVIVMHYIGGMQIDEIARQLNVPVGTVKRRLHVGRERMKKEQNKLATKELGELAPMKVSLTWSGRMNDVEKYLCIKNHITQDILACAYEKPLTLLEISEKLGIPVYYIEDFVAEAVDKEIMARIGDRYYTDAFLCYFDDILKTGKSLEAFATKYRNEFAHSLSEIEKMVDSEYTKNIPEHHRVKLKRFFTLMALENFKGNFLNRKLEFPNRKDGGNWVLHGSLMPLGQKTEYKYGLGGLRHTGTDNYALYEYDTALHDCIARYINIGWVSYTSKLIYAVYTNQNPIELGIPAEMVEKMPKFIEYGLFTKDRKIDIPVISQEEYDKLSRGTIDIADKLTKVLSDAFKEWIESNKIGCPDHLPQVTKECCNVYSLIGFEMAVCQDLYENGLHLKDVDYCCPPVVFVID